jgi:UDP-GlcNAc:undecaprenyl-phosphate GlcNAc-1-phosphate transferase
VLSHLAVFATAAIVTGLAAPLAARLARRMGAIDVPADPRRVHREPVPTLGGLGMAAGLAAAMGIAWLLPWFRPVFEDSSEVTGVLLGVLLLISVGMIDDLRDLPPTIKLAGQITAATLVALFGVQLVHAWVPGVGVVVLDSNLGLPLTVVAIVAMVNAVNLIDGLDGLAAGIVAIAATAFFVFSVIADNPIAESSPSAAPLIAASLAGICVGFLVHNWHPASVFMGDTGSMMLGLLLASAGIAYVGRSTAPVNADYAGVAPLLAPALILAVPFVDSAFAVLRRLKRRQPLMLADKGHLHHLLITFGHSHRRAVLTLYWWSLVVAFATVGPLFIELWTVVWVVVGATGIGAAALALSLRRSGADRADEPPARPHLVEVS